MYIFLSYLTLNTLSLWFSQCERPSFTTIQNNRQNYSSAYVNIYIFRYENVRQNILHRIIASIAWPQPALNFFMTGVELQDFKIEMFFPKNYKQRWYFEPFITISYKPIHPNISLWFVL
jgi:hypothetical protein